MKNSNRLTAIFCMLLGSVFITCFWGLSSATAANISIPAQGADCHGTPSYTLEWIPQEGETSYHLNAFVYNPQWIPIVNTTIQAPADDHVALNWPARHAAHDQHVAVVLTYILNGMPFQDQQTCVIRKQ